MDGLPGQVDEERLAGRVGLDDVARALAEQDRRVVDVGAERPAVVPAVRRVVVLRPRQKAEEAVEAPVGRQVRRRQEPGVALADPVGLVPPGLQLAGDQGPAQVDVIARHRAQPLAVVKRQPARHEAAPGWGAVEMDEVVGEDDA